MNATDIGFDFAYTLSRFDQEGFRDVTQIIDQTIVIPYARMLEFNIKTNLFVDHILPVRQCTKMLGLESYQVFPNVPEEERKQRLTDANCVGVKDLQFWGDLNEGNFFYFSLLTCTPERAL